MVTMLKMLGLPVMGYVSPDVNGRTSTGEESRGVTNGGEPAGYVLGTQCVKVSDTSWITWDTCGYETYASLYAMSSSCCCKAKGFRTHKLGDLVPIMGCNTKGGTYYACDRSCVQEHYECNYKVNEAHIPYIAGDLIDHGSVSYDVLPTEPINSNSWVTVSSDTEDLKRYFNSRDVKCLVCSWSNIQKDSKPGCNSVGLISCLACFYCYPKINTGSTANQYGFLKLVRLYGVTEVKDGNTVIGYNRRNGAAATYASDSELTPNDGEYLAVYNENPNTHELYVTHLFEYNAAYNGLGSNRISDTGNTVSFTIPNRTLNVYSNNQDGIPYRMYVSSDITTKGIFVVVPLLTQTDGYCAFEMNPAIDLRHGFANHMTIDPNTLEISLSNGCINGYSEDGKIGCLYQCSVLGKVAINCLYVPSLATNMLRVGHWNVSDRISSTAEAQLRLGTAETEPESNTSGGE